MERHQLLQVGISQSVYGMDVGTGMQKFQLTGHKEIVMSVCFAPDGASLASCSSDKQIFLWDVKTGNLKFQLYGHSNSVNSVCFSPDGTTLVSGSMHGLIRFWDLENFKHVQYNDSNYLNKNDKVQSALSNFKIYFNFIKFLTQQNLQYVKIIKCKPLELYSFRNELYIIKA